MPEDRLRELEIAMNDAFDTYREMCVGEPSRRWYRRSS